MGFIVKDKICIVTGSAQGIGKEIAKRLLDQGAKVCISDVNDNLCEETAQNYQNEYGKKRVTSFRSLWEYTNYFSHNKKITISHR